jgi:hypothetical protein
MSFLDDIVDAGSGLLGGAWDMLSGSGVAAGIAKAAALGFLLKQVTNSINKENSRPETANNPTIPDQGVRLQVDPDTTHSIPIIYGDAHLGGILTDARITGDNQTMYYCYVLSERTGTLLSDDSQSVISFAKIYWDNKLITFQSDGITVASFTDDAGGVDTNPNGLIRIYCYNNGSSSPVVPVGYTNGSLNSAYAVMPDWTSSHTMDQLVFAIIRVDYNAEKNVKGIADVNFKLSNTMTQPGDCLYDYMTNTRYGAGIDPTEIYSE